MVETIREYRILSMLGEGGMGRVYLADDPMLDRKVALKVLNSEFVKDPGFIARFKQEAKVQSSLRHSNIVALHTFFQEEGKYCMVLEYAEGETLKSLIERRGALPVDRAVRIMAQILDAVGHAHSKEIIHRDIKPSNIMIGPNDAVKVMDFGIAKILGERGLTKTGAKVGTLYYMSPEQVTAPKSLDQRTDVYSLGIVLYEMLTGKIPFDTDTESDFELMQQIVDRPVPSVASVVSGIPQNVAECVRAATMKDRNERIASCDSFRAVLLGKLPHAVPLKKSVPLPAIVAPVPPPPRPGVGGWLGFFGIVLVGFAPFGCIYAVGATAAGLEQVNRWSYQSSDDVRIYLLLNLLLTGIVTGFSIRAGAAILGSHQEAIRRVRAYSNVYLGLGLLEAFLPLVVNLQRFAGMADGVSFKTGFLATVVWYLVITSYFKKSKRVRDTLGQNLKSIPWSLYLPVGSRSMNSNGSSAAAPGVTSGPRTRAAYYSLAITAAGTILFGMSGFPAFMMFLLLPVAVLAGSEFFVGGVTPPDSARGTRMPFQVIASGIFAGFLPFLFPLLASGGVEAVFVATLYGGLMVGIPIVCLRHIDNRKPGLLSNGVFGLISRDTLSGWGRVSAAALAVMKIIQFVYLISGDPIPFQQLTGGTGVIYFIQFLGALAVIPVGVRILEEGGKVPVVWMGWALGGIVLISIMMLPALCLEIGLFRFNWVGPDSVFIQSGASVLNSIWLSARIMVGLWLVLVILAKYRHPGWPNYLLWLAGAGALFGLMPLYAQLDSIHLISLAAYYGVICPSSWGTSGAMVLSTLFHIGFAGFFGALAYKWSPQDKRA